MQFHTDPTRESMSKTDALIALCESHVGEHYESAEWKAAADESDWSQHWPIVDGAGNLTGEVYESGMHDAPYANVGDMAMVLISDLSRDAQAHITRQDDQWDGYARGV